MTQVSKNYLAPKVKEQIYDTFLSAISDLTTPSSTRTFLHDLLSNTEITMLGKRLSIAYMLRKNYTQREICSILKVSLGTVNKINSTLQTQGNGYKQIVDRMLKEDKITAFFDKLSTKLDKALPPRGANWSEHYKNSQKKQAKSRKSF